MSPTTSGYPVVFQNWTFCGPGHQSRLGSAIKNLGLFSKSPGDFRVEKMGFYSSLGRSTPGVLLPRLP